MKVLGLTGGIGMGKSTADQLLRQRGLTVIDTDLLARELVEPGQPALAQIEKAFGSDMLDPSGRLRRAELAKVVFADPSKRLLLEEILHPRIRAGWRAQVGRLRAAVGPPAPSQPGLAGLKEAPPPVFVIVIPLLFETGAQDEFDATVCVACSTTAQRERLKARGWPDEEISRRLQAQWPIERKIAAANYVIWTEGPLEVHSAQWDQLLASLGCAGFRSSGVSQAADSRPRTSLEGEAHKA